MKLSERIERDQKRDQKRIEKCEKRPLSLFERIHWRHFIRERIKLYGYVTIRVGSFNKHISFIDDYIDSKRRNAFNKWLDINGLYYINASQIFVYTKQGVEDLKIDCNVLWQKDGTNELSTCDLSGVEGWTLIFEKEEN